MTSQKRSVPQFRSLSAKNKSKKKRKRRVSKAKHLGAISDEEEEESAPPATQQTSTLVRVRDISEHHC